MVVVIISGIVLMVLGILIYIDPVIYGYDVPKESGVVLIIIGGLWIFYFLREVKKYSKNKSSTDYADFVICTDCRKPFSNIDAPSEICPSCGGRLENLSGFYERHPELKEDQENK